MNSVARRALPETRTTREEFLRFLESRPDERRELIDGVSVMTVGVSIRHSRMVANVHAAIRSTSRRSGCETPFGDTFVGRTRDDRFLLVPDVYQSIATGSQIRLVHQNEIRIENWTRLVANAGADPFGLEVVSTPSSAVPPVGLDGDLTLEDVYEGVDLKTGTSF